jgi:transposase
LAVISACSSGAGRLAPNARTETLLPIIEEKVTPDSIVYTDTFKAYNVLEVTTFHHMQINHFKIFADRLNHINGIENFLNQAKRHLRRFNGIKSRQFPLVSQGVRMVLQWRQPSKPIRTA